MLTPGIIHSLACHSPFLYPPDPSGTKPATLLGIVLYASSPRFRVDTIPDFPCNSLSQVVLTPVAQLVTTLINDTLCFCPSREVDNSILTNTQGCNEPETGNDDASCHRECYGINSHSPHTYHWHRYSRSQPISSPIFHEREFE
jgi:hypothetical protein